jgi:GDPmannose 4,6-dehydratase
MQKSCIVTGITGQDGSILTEKLLKKGYKVYGLIRRSSRGLDLGCSAGLEDYFLLEVVEGDITDLPSMEKLCKLAKADMFFGAAAQSHVGSSFDQPVYTAQCTGIGVLNCLEAIKQSGYHTRFLNASTSEMFGGLSSEPCNEETPFHPRSPYGVAKLFGYWTTINYRETYKMFACSTIAFNHEEPGKRGPNFVTRKISLAVAAIKKGKQDYLYLGNLDARRDWGLASDYCDAMIAILESSHPEDYVLATGETHSVREFCEIAFKHAELGDYRDYVKVDPRFYRPCEVDVLIGDAGKIESNLGWKPETTFHNLVCGMVDYDIAEL